MYEHLADANLVDVLSFMPEPRTASEGCGPHRRQTVVQLRKYNKTKRLLYLVMSSLSVEVESSVSPRPGMLRALGTNLAELRIKASFSHGSQFRPTSPELPSQNSALSQQEMHEP